MSRRLLARVLFLLVVGGVINIVVAWGCALYAQDQRLPASEPTFDEKQALCLRYDLPPLGLPPNGRIEGLGYVEVSVGTQITHGSDHPLGEHITITEIEAGWPFKALRKGMLHSQDLPSFWKSQVWLRRSVASTNAPSAIVPINPIWSGFALNTGIYAAVFFGMIAMAAILRRIMRWKRGLCLACGYPVGVSPICTECGRPIRRLWPRCALTQPARSGWAGSCAADRSK